MNVTFRLLIVSILALLCSCHPSTKSEAHDASPEERPAQVPFRCASEGLDCLAEACGTAGGRFSTELKKCSCGSGKTFVVRAGQPRCILSNVENDCLGRHSGFDRAVENPETLSLCSGFENQSRDGERLATMYVDLESTSETERRKFASWADTKFWDDFNFQFWVSPTAFGEHILIGPSDVADIVIEGWLKPYDLPDEPIDYINYPVAPKYFVASNDAIAFLSDRTRKSSTERAESRLKVRDAAAATALAAYRNAPAGLAYTVESRYRAGCLRSCVARSERFRISGLQAWFEKNYFHGGLYRSALFLADERNVIRAQLLLADHAISVVMALDRDETGLLIEARGYDLNGDQIFAKALNGSGRNAEETGRLDSDPQRYDLLIGVCEDGLNISSLNQANLDPTIIRGPLANSYYGWSTGLTPKDYWMGRYSLNDLGASNPGAGASHATQTASVLLRAEDDGLRTGLIPLGIEACLQPQRVATWWPQFRAAGARVLNLSATDELDSETCRERLDQHPLTTEPKHALWIAAAGNRGQRSSRGCPQHLAGRPNLIIVGASDGKRLHPRSNHGETLVDILAPGEALSAKAWGTSFAAPRVSRVAAKIFRRYPTLSPSQVKQAILLGADIPRTPLPVRSRGILNARRAEEIASGLAQGQNIETILIKTFCGSYVTYPCTRAAEKLSLNNEWINEGGLQ